MPRSTTRFGLTQALALMKALILAILLTATAGCYSVREWNYSSDQLDVSAAVFQALFGNNASADMPNKKGAALCFGSGKNPNKSFLARFTGSSPPVIPCSAVSNRRDSTNETISARTGKPVIVFSVSEVQLTSATTATAIGGYYEASLSSAEYTFQLEKRDAVWVVVSQTMNWIS